MSFQPNAASRPQWTSYIQENNFELNSAELQQYGRKSTSRFVQFFVDRFSTNAEAFYTQKANKQIDMLAYTFVKKHVPTKILKLHASDIRQCAAAIYKINSDQICEGLQFRSKQFNTKIFFSQILSNKEFTNIANKIHNLPREARDALIKEATSETALVDLFSRVHTSSPQPTSDVTTTKRSTPKEVWNPQLESCLKTMMQQKELSISTKIEETAKLPQFQRFMQLTDKEQTVVDDILTNKQLDKGPLSEENSLLFLRALTKHLLTTFYGENADKSKDLLLNLFSGLTHENAASIREQISKTNIHHLVVDFVKQKTAIAEEVQQLIATVTTDDPSSKTPDLLDVEQKFNTMISKLNNVVFSEILTTEKEKCITICREKFEHANKNQIEQLNTYAAEIKKLCEQAETLDTMKKLDETLDNFFTLQRALQKKSRSFICETLPKEEQTKIKKSLVESSWFQGQIGYASEFLNNNVQTFIKQGKLTPDSLYQIKQTIIGILPKQAALDSSLINRKNTLAHTIIGQLICLSGAHQEKEESAGVMETNISQLLQSKNKNDQLLGNELKKLWGEFKIRPKNISDAVGKAECLNVTGQFLLQIERVTTFAQQLQQEIGKISSKKEQKLQAMLPFLNKICKEKAEQFKQGILGQFPDRKEIQELTQAVLNAKGQAKDAAEKKFYVYIRSTNANVIQHITEIQQVVEDYLQAYLYLINATSLVLKSVKQDNRSPKINDFIEGIRTGLLGGLPLQLTELLINTSAQKEYRKDLLKMFHNTQSLIEKYNHHENKYIDETLFKTITKESPTKAKKHTIKLPALSNPDPGKIRENLKQCSRGGNRKLIVYNQRTLLASQINNQKFLEGLAKADIKDQISILEIALQSKKTQQDSIETALAGLKNTFQQLSLKEQSETFCYLLTYENDKAVGKAYTTILEHLV